MIILGFDATFFDEAGNCWEIGPDDEGLGLLMIKGTGEELGKNKFMFTREEGQALATAITKILELNKEIE